MDKEKLVLKFKALSDLRRLEILKMISVEEKCACVLLEKLDLTQSGLSYHMKILTDSELVIPRQDGKWTHYSINKEFTKDILEFFNSISK